MNHIEHIFVYGSLTEGMVHYDRVKNFVKSVYPAWASGYCFRLPVGYPVLSETCPQAEGATSVRVEGQVLEIEATDVVFKILDEFHGFNPLQLEKSLFFKKPVQVQPEAGSNLFCESGKNPGKCCLFGRRGLAKKHGGAAGYDATAYRFSSVLCEKVGVFDGS